MCRLVENLKRGRESLTNQFHQVKRLGVHTMEGRNQLMESKKTLLKQLQNGNMQLCSKIKETTTQDEKLLALVEAYEDVTRKLETFCTEFFSKYEQSGGGIEFFRDFDKLKVSLENQMQKEGHILHAI